MFIEKIDQIEIQKMFMSLEKEMDRCPLDKVPNCAKIILKKRPIDFEKSELLIAHILGNLITVIFDYQILRKPLKILSL